MNRTSLTAFMIFCLLSTVFLIGLAFNIQTVKASGTIYIKADGSVDPPDAPISSVDNVTYTFTDDINDSIVVERDNIVVDGRGYKLQGNGTGKGIDLTDRSNVTTKNTKIETFEFGIWLYPSSNNKVLENHIANNTFGVWIFASNNTLSRNTITNNSDSGVVIDVDSSNNTISGNNITNNNRGVWLILASDNRFYHNNFIDNTQHVHISTSGYANLWDNGYPSGGNYWSNYTGVDRYHGPNQDILGSDGTGDTPHIIDGNNTDTHPLMGTFSDFNVTWKEQSYYLATICNSTISNFCFGVEYDGLNRTISFNLTGDAGTVGFCRILIPRNLMEGPYAVLIDEEVTNATELPISNSTHAFLYLTYIHSIHTATIFSWRYLLGKYSESLADYQSLNSTYYELLDAYNELLFQYTTLNATYHQLLDNHNELLTDFDALNATYQALLSDYYDLNSTYHALLSDYAELQGNYTSLQNNYNNLQAEFNALNATYLALLSDHTELQGSYASLQNNYNDLSADFDALNIVYHSLNSSYYNLQSDYEWLDLTYNDLWRNYDSLNLSYINLQAEYNLLTSSYNDLSETFNEYKETTERELTYIRNQRNAFIAATIILISTTVILIATTVYLAIRKPKIKS